MPFTKTFHGFIENITDTLLIIEACRSGLLPTINRRLIERERSAIKSGTIIVFDESESGIKRWTDGYLWSPSRILGNFLVYRELANRENRAIEDDYSLSRQQSNVTNSEEESNIALIHQKERALVGSLTTANTSYNFKQDGLIKKTIRIMVNGNYLHIVSYYSKNDVLNNLLPTPSASPQLACLQISADLMPHLQGYHSLGNTAGGTTRKRSRSYDEHQYMNHSPQRICASTRERMKSCNNNTTMTRPLTASHHFSPYSSFVYGNNNNNHAGNQNMLPSQPLDYPTVYGKSHSMLGSDFYHNNKAPFTELPPPLRYDYKQKYQTSSSNNSTSDPLSPSLSPTPSPPTTLPGVSSVTSCDNVRVNTFFHSPPEVVVNHHFDNYRPRIHHSTLDNY